MLSSSFLKKISEKVQKAPIAFAFLIVAISGTFLAFYIAKNLIYQDGLQRFEVTSGELRAVIVSRINRTIDLPVVVAKNLKIDATKGELDNYMKSLELESRYPGTREVGIYSHNGTSVKRFYRYTVTSGVKTLTESDIKKAISLKKSENQNEAFLLKLNNGEVNYIILSSIDSESYFFVIFDATSVLNRLFVENSIFNNIDFKIYDTIDPNFPIFETNSEELTQNKKSYSNIQTIKFGIYPWTLNTFGNQKEILSVTAQRMPAVVLFSGLAVSLLMFGILWALSWSRKNAIILAEKITKNLRESEEKYRSIFNSLQDVYYQTDLEGNIKTISPSIETYTGLKPESLIGENASSFYKNPKDRDALLAELSKKGFVKDYPLTLLANDNIPIFCSLNARLVKNEKNEIIGVEGLIRDISDRKLASDALKERTKELERLNKLMIGRELRMVELKEELKKYGKK